MMHAGRFTLLTAAAFALAACSGGGATSGPVPSTAASGSPAIAAPAPSPATSMPAASPPPGASATMTPAAQATASGPAYDVSPALLAASLTCEKAVANASREPVLLVPGTTLTPSVNFDWNYEPGLDANGIPWCAVTLPENAMGDIATAGEYVAYAIRTMAASANRKIDVLGYSQGGMVPRWALKYWPDTRGLVDAYVAIDPSNHGTADAYGVCATACAPAFWQQESGSHFLTALNTGPETFAGISYTVAYSLADEVVVPNLPVDSSSSLAAASNVNNIAVQTICPNDASDHLAMGSYDPVAYALALDAFTHAGPASASRIPASVCLEPFNPGVNGATFAQSYAAYDTYVVTTIATTPTVNAEPSLPPYATGS